MADNETIKDTTPEEEPQAVPEVAEAASAAEEVVKIAEPAVADGAEDVKISGFAKVDALMKGSVRTDLPEFRSGDQVKVHVKIIEGNKERIQVFEGVVIAMKHGGIDKTFTVRKTSWGVGVERTFFASSPKVDKVEVVRRGQVRRAKLYYLRERAGKSARIREKRAQVTKE
jgi:large subunit ribosomal protein L19